MDIQNALTQLILAALTLVFGVAGKYVNDFLAAKSTSEKYGFFIQLAKTAVTAAEQSIGGAGEDKKTAVVKYISEKVGNALTPDEIDKLVESAVYDMNTQVLQPIQQIASTYSPAVTTSQIAPVIQQTQGSTAGVQQQASDTPVAAPTSVNTATPVVDTGVQIGTPPAGLQTVITSTSGGGANA